MSRSSFFGLAISSALATMPRFAVMVREGWVEPLAKVKAGGLRTGKSPGKKPAR
jgi:hypothetical protein